jgi:hypothetical protein
MPLILDGLPREERRLELREWSAEIGKRNPGRFSFFQGKLQHKRTGLKFYGFGKHYSEYSGIENVRQDEPVVIIKPTFFIGKPDFYYVAWGLAIGGRTKPDTADYSKAGFKILPNLFHGRI